MAYLDFDSDVFRGKTALCPCDDPEWSNFTKYAFYGISEISTHIQEYSIQ
jgi:hypothetical protein